MGGKTLRTVVQEKLVESRTRQREVRKAAKREKRERLAIMTAKEEMERKTASNRASGYGDGEGSSSGSSSGSSENSEGEEEKNEEKARR